MSKVYLFDWGDTIMVEFPGIPGKMRDWPHVEVVTGAEDALRCLSRHADIYVATGAAQSGEAYIRAPPERVELNRFTTGYYCRANLALERAPWISCPGFPRAGFG